MSSTLAKVLLLAGIGLFAGTVYMQSKATTKQTRLDIPTSSGSGLADSDLFPH